MGVKVFAEKGRVKLVGDERDVAVATWWRDAVWQWCDENSITIEYQGSLSGTDVWRVRDDKQRVWFILKWA